METQPITTASAAPLSYDAAKALGRDILQRWGDPCEGNDRIATLELRPGMSEGEYLALALRCWGEGHWCRTDGEAHYFTKREDAAGKAQLWVEKGVRR